MNHTVISPEELAEQKELIAKLKRLNLEIEELRSEFNTFGHLDAEKTLLLELKENKLTKLINQL